MSILVRFSWLALGTALLALPTLSIAQTQVPPGVNLRFEHFALKDGLSQMTVLSVTQDRQGFLWLGTQDGLNRYHGYGFDVYRHEPGDSTSLSESFVQVVYEDSGRNLWVGTWGGGLNRLDRASGGFRRFEHHPEDPGSLADDIVLSLFEDSRGTLWVGTAGGLDRFDADTGTFTHFRHDPDDSTSLSDNFIWSIAEDQAGSLWIGTYSGGLNRTHRTGDGSADDIRFRRYSHSSIDPKSLSDDANVTVYVDGDGAIWAGTANGLNRYNADGDDFARFAHDSADPTSLCDPMVLSLFEDRDRTLWVGTANGLCRFDHDSRRFARFHHNPADPTSLSNSVIRTLYEDRSGILWVGTGGGGINKYNRATERFGHYKHDPNNPTSLSHNFVWDFVEDEDGSVWIGTDGGGVDRFNPQDGTFLNMRHDSANPATLSDDVVLSLASSGGALWVGTYSGGLNRVDRPSGSVRRYVYTGDDRGPSSPSVNALLPDAEGDLWIGTWGGGLNHFDTSTERVQAYRHDPEDARSLSSDLVTCLLQDRHGRLWVGTNGGGLNRLDAGSGRFTRYVHDDQSAGSLSHDTVYDLYEDDEGTLWIATAGGLNRFDSDSSRFQTLAARDGLPHSIIYGIEQDASGHLWLSTNGGIARLDTKTGSVDAFRVSDGLQSNEFNAGAVLRSSTDELYFGGVNGFNRFDPEAIQQSTHIPPVVLTGFKRYDEEIGRDVDLSELSSIDLPYDDNFITFEFAALDFVDPRHNRFAFMLEGIDSDWRFADGGSRSASYTKLDPGRYRFRLRGSNSDGIWNEAGLTLAVNVIPPWWNTWWFRALAAAAFLGVLTAGAARWHRTNLREQERRREEAVEVHRHLAEARESERMHMARELHDGAVQDLYGARLQLEAIATSLDGKDRRRMDGVQDTLHHVYSTLRDLSREWRPPILVSFGLAKAIRAHAAHTTQAHPEISMTLDITDDAAGVLSERVRLALYRIYQEAIRNVLRHADAGEVQVSMTITAEQVNLSIRDDGHGFSVPARLADFVRENHLGLIGAAERAGTLGGALHVDSRIGEGTTVRVSVPLDSRR